jgi:hypothetical protein
MNASTEQFEHVRLLRELRRTVAVDDLNVRAE